jgi:hypothetical protein
VHFENQVITASVANLGTLINAAKIKNRQDFVYALVKVVSTEEDQVRVHTPADRTTTCQFRTGCLSHRTASLAHSWR